MIAFVVTLIFFMIVLACGIIVNMYLYTRGLFHAHRPPRRARSVEDWEEEHFSLDVSGHHDVTGSYVRKGLLLTVAAVLLACFVMVTLLVPAWH